MPAEDLLLPGYYNRLYEAQAGSEEVDNFDLHSEDPESKAEFDELKAAADQAQLDLIGYVVQNWQALVKDIMDVGDGTEVPEDQFFDAPTLVKRLVRRRAKKMQNRHK